MSFNQGNQGTNNLGQRQEVKEGQKDKVLNQGQQGQSSLQHGLSGQSNLGAQSEIDWDVNKDKNLNSKPNMS